MKCKRCKTDEANNAERLCTTCYIGQTVTDQMRGSGLDPSQIGLAGIVEVSPDGEQRVLGAEDVSAIGNINSVLVPIVAAQIEAIKVAMRKVPKEDRKDAIQWCIDQMTQFRSELVKGGS